MHGSYKEVTLELRTQTGWKDTPCKRGRIVVLVSHKIPKSKLLGQSKKKLVCLKSINSQTLINIQIPNSKISKHVKVNC